MTRSDRLDALISAIIILVFSAGFFYLGVTNWGRASLFLFPVAVILLALSILPIKDTIRPPLG